MADDLKPFSFEAHAAQAPGAEAVTQPATGAELHASSPADADGEPRPRSTATAWFWRRDDQDDRRADNYDAITFYQRSWA
jgi:hypothetical protein